jgi:hypothetical protein
VTAGAWIAWTAALAWLLAATALPLPADAMPLSKPEVLRLLQKGVSQERVVEVVKELGIDFSITADVLSELTGAGAGDALIAQLMALRRDDPPAAERPVEPPPVLPPAAGPPPAAPPATASVKDAPAPMAAASPAPGAPAGAASVAPARPVVTIEPPPEPPAVPDPPPGAPATPAVVLPAIPAPPPVPPPPAPTAVASLAVAAPAPAPAVAAPAAPPPTASAPGPAESPAAARAPEPPAPAPRPAARPDAAPAGPTEAERREQVRPLLESAQALANDGDLRGAQEAIARALEIDPGAPEVWRVFKAIEHDVLVRAEGYLVDGQVRRALREFQTIVTRNPDSAAGHAGMGLALIQLRSYDEAVTALERALQLDPGNARYRQTLTRARDFLKASKAFERTGQENLQRMLGDQPGKKREP